MTDRRVKIRGKYWWLKFVTAKETHGHLGECDHPTVSEKSIRIRKTLKGENRLDTIIHELLHAGQWDLNEEAVEELASDIARVLTALGYREGCEAPGE